MEEKKLFKTIRIYEKDHDFLLNSAQKTENFAEIIENLIKKTQKGCENGDSGFYN